MPPSDAVDAVPTQPPRLSLVRDPYRSLYLMIVACVAADFAIVPLLPGLRVSYGLSSAETALLLSAGTAAMILAPVPLGRLADRVGPRRLVTAAGVSATVASVILATAPGFWALLLGRSLIGLTNAILWTAGVAQAADRPAAIVRAIAAGGAGRLCGPALAGSLAGAAGSRGVFAAAGLLTLATTIAFQHSHAGARTSARVAAPTTYLGRLGPALRQPRVRAAILGLLLLGFTDGAANLLAATQLHAAGLNAAGIGALITIAAAAALACATGVRRLVERHDAIPLLAAAAAALGLAWLIPAATASIPTLAAFLIAAAAARTLLNPASYLLAHQGAVTARTGTAVTLGLTNLALGAAGLAGPIAASIGLAHPRLTETVVAVLILGIAASLARRPGGVGGSVDSRAAGVADA